MNWALLAEPPVWVAMWVVAAGLLSMLPTRRSHWPLAWVLLGIGLPLLGWTFAAAGPLWGLLALGVGCAVLRWPLRYGLRHLRRLAGGDRP